MLTAVEISRQLGFLRFRSFNFSRSFVEQNFPTIYLCGPSAQDDRGTKVRIAYSREKEDRARARAEGDWTCRMVGKKISVSRATTNSLVFYRELFHPKQVLPLPSTATWYVVVFEAVFV